MTFISEDVAQYRKNTKKRKDEMIMRDYAYALEIIKKRLETKYISPEIKYAFEASIEALEKQMPKADLCASAEKLENGKCKGYQKSESNDEPLNICMDCECSMFDD